jgi:hypothetical protein
MTNGALKHGKQAEVKYLEQKVEYGAFSFSLHSKILLIRYLNRFQYSTSALNTGYAKYLRKKIQAPISHSVAEEFTEVRTIYTPSSMMGLKSSMAMSE